MLPNQHIGHTLLSAPEDFSSAAKYVCDTVSVSLGVGNAWSEVDLASGHNKQALSAEKVRGLYVFHHPLL